MIEVGKYNILKVIKESQTDICLDAENFGELVLSKDELPANYQLKEQIQVFLYFNSKEEAVATTQEPYGCVGEFACLEVIDRAEIGAFLDWGLPKDLFVPANEQERSMEKGEKYIVYIYKDSKRNRLAASAKLQNYLKKEPAGFIDNQKVELLIAHETELGVNAIVNNSYWGLLYHDELFQNLEYGQRISGYVKKIREDAKIDLSLQLQGYQKTDSLQEEIISYLSKANRKITLTDKSSPEVIYDLFAVSKKKYKMALGALYKNKRIVIEESAIRIKE